MRDGTPVHFRIMKKNKTRTDIICIGMELIALHGYNTTGIDAVLKQAGVPKGSFNHFFGSKEEFGLGVIDHFADHCDEKLRTFFDDEEVPPLNRIRNYFENGLLDMAENRFTKGCLIGNLGQELTGQNERFRARIETIFSAWQQRFAACLHEAKQKGQLASEADPAVIAEFILSGWEGAILRAKVMKDSQPLRNFTDTLFATVLHAR